MLENYKLKHPVRFKYLFTVTTFSKYLALSMFIIFPIIGFYLGILYKSKTPIPEKVKINQPIQKQIKLESKYKLIKSNNMIFFVDNQFDYFVNFSTYPDVSVSEVNKESYDFDLYKKMNDFNASSVARLTLQSPIDNAGLTLNEYTTKKYDYINKGGYTGSDGEVVTSQITKVKISGNDAITWTSKSTSNNYFSSDYLISMDGKYLHVILYSWNLTDYQNALSGFNTLLNSISFSK